MTPKQKALELFDKFMKPVDGLHKYPMCFDTAKQCALIAVDLILSEFYADDFYTEVKQELEKL
jgi:hypothetical protein